MTYSKEDKKKVETEKSVTNDTEKNLDARSAPKQPKGKGKQKGTKGTNKNEGKGGKSKKTLLVDNPDKTTQPEKQNMVAAISALCPAPIPRPGGFYDMDVVQRDNVSMDFKEFTRFVPLSTEHLTPALVGLYEKLLEKKLGQSINTVSFTKELFMYHAYSTLIVMWYIQTFNLCGEKLRSQFGLHGYDAPALKRMLNLDVGAEDQYTAESIQTLIRPYLAPRIVETPTGTFREIPVIMVDVDATNFAPHRLRRLVEDKHYNDQMTIFEYMFHFPYANGADPLEPAPRPPVIPADRWNAVENEKKYIRQLLAHLNFGNILNRTEFNRVFRIDLVTEFCPIQIGHLRAVALQSISQQGFSESPSEYTTRPTGLTEPRLRDQMSGVCGMPNENDANIAAFVNRRHQAGFVNIYKNLTQVWNYWADSRIHRLFFQSNVTLSSGQRNLVAQGKSLSVTVEPTQPTINLILDSIDGLNNAGVFEDHYDVMTLRQGRGNTLKFLGIDNGLNREITTWMFRAFPELKPVKISIDETGAPERMLPHITQALTRVPIPLVIGPLNFPIVADASYNSSTFHFRNKEMAVDRATISTNVASGVVARWQKPQLISPANYRLNPTAANLFTNIATAAYVAGGPEIERNSENLITDGAHNVTIPRLVYLKSNFHRNGYPSPHLFLRVTDSAESTELKMYSTSCPGFSTTRGEPVISIRN